MKACFFNIYYNVRLYFDEYKLKFDVQNINGFDVYADIYTYSHLINRHYFPNMNKGLGASMNDNIPGVNMRNLPNSLLNLVYLYSKQKQLKQAIEYLLFKINGDPYILWIKYGKIGILQNRKGFEIRSFYKCEQQFDLDKFDNTSDVKIGDGIFAAVK